MSSPNSACMIGSIPEVGSSRTRSSGTTHEGADEAPPCAGCRSTAHGSGGWDRGRGARSSLPMSVGSTDPRTDAQVGQGSRPPRAGRRAGAHRAGTRWSGVGWAVEDRGSASKTRSDTPVRSGQPHEQPEGGGLPGSVRSEEAGHGSTADRQVEVVQRLDRPEGVAQPPTPAPPSACRARSSAHHRSVAGARRPRRRRPGTGRARPCRRWRTCG